MTRKIGCILLVFLFLLVGCSNVKKEGSFDELVIQPNPFNNFDGFIIQKDMAKKIDIRHNYENELTQDFLDYFKELKLERIDSLPEDVPSFSECQYIIHFLESKPSQGKRSQSIGIYVRNEEYIEVSTFINDEEAYNRKRKVDSFYCRLVSSRLNFDYFEKIYNSLPKNTD